MKTRLRIKGYDSLPNQEINRAFVNWLFGKYGYTTKPAACYNYPEAVILAKRQIAPDSQKRLADYFSIVDNEVIESNGTDEAKLEDYTPSTIVLDDPDVVKVTPYKGTVKRDLTITLYSYSREYIDKGNDFLTDWLANHANDTIELTLANVTYTLDQSTLDYIYYLKKWNNDSKGITVPTIDTYLPESMRKRSYTNISLVGKIVSKDGPTVHKELKHGVKQYALTVKLEVRYERDLFLVFEHKHIVHNKLLAPELLKTIGIYEDEPQDWVRDAGKMNIRHLADKRLAYPRIPMVDDFKYNIDAITNYSPLFSVLLVVGTDKKLVANIKQLPGIDIAKPYLRHILNNRDSVLTSTDGLFHIAVYTDTGRFNPTGLKLNSNGDIKSNVNMDIADTYRLVLYMKTDIQHISTEEKDDVMDLLKPYVDNFVNNKEYEHSNLLTYDQVKNKSGRKYKASGINLVDEANDIVTVGGKKLKDLGKVVVDTAWFAKSPQGETLPITIPAFVPDPLPVEYDDGLPKSIGSIDENWAIDIPFIHEVYGEFEPGAEREWTGSLTVTPYTPVSGYPGPHDETIWEVQLTDDDGNFGAKQIFTDPKYKNGPLPLVPTLFPPEPDRTYRVTCKYKSNYPEAPKTSWYQENNTRTQPFGIYNIDFRPVYLPNGDVDLFINVSIRQAPMLVGYITKGSYEVTINYPDPVTGENVPYAAPITGKLNIDKTKIEKKFKVTLPKANRKHTIQSSVSCKITVENTALENINKQSKTAHIAINGWTYVAPVGIKTPTLSRNKEDYLWDGIVTASAYATTGGYQGTHTKTIWYIKDSLNPGKITTIDDPQYKDKLELIQGVFRGNRGIYPITRSITGMQYQVACQHVSDYAPDPKESNIEWMTIDVLPLGLYVTDTNAKKEASGHYTITGNIEEKIYPTIMGSSGSALIMGGALHPVSGKVFKEVGTGITYDTNKTSAKIDFSVSKLDTPPVGDTDLIVFEFTATAGNEILKTLPSGTYKFKVKAEGWGYAGPKTIVTPSWHTSGEGDQWDGTLISSPYTVTNGYLGLHDFSRWRIKDNNEVRTYGSGNGIYKTTLPLTELEPILPGATYEIAVQHVCFQYFKDRKESEFVYQTLTVPNFGINKFTMTAAKQPNQDAKLTVTTNVSSIKFVGDITTAELTVELIDSVTKDVYQTYKRNIGCDGTDVVTEITIPKEDMKPNQTVEIKGTLFINNAYMKKISRDTEIRTLEYEGWVRNAEEFWKIAQPSVDLPTGASEDLLWNGHVVSSAYTPMNAYPGEHTRTEWYIKEDSTEITKTVTDLEYKTELPLLGKIIQPRPGKIVSIGCKYFSDYGGVTRDSGEVKWKKITVPNFETKIVSVTGSDSTERPEDEYVLKIQLLAPAIKFMSDGTKTTSIVTKLTSDGTADTLIYQLDPLVVNNTDGTQTVTQVIPKSKLIPNGTTKLIITASRDDDYLKKYNLDQDTATWDVTLVNGGDTKEWKIAKPALSTPNYDGNDIDTLDKVIISTYTPVNNYPGEADTVEWDIDNTGDLDHALYHTDDATKKEGIKVSDIEGIFKSGKTIQARARYVSKFRPYPLNSPWSDVLSITVPQYGIKQVSGTIATNENDFTLTVTREELYPAFLGTVTQQPITVVVKKDGTTDSRSYTIPVGQNTLVIPKDDVDYASYTVEFTVSVENTKLVDEGLNSKTGTVRFIKEGLDVIEKPVIEKLGFLPGQESMPISRKDAYLIASAYKAINGYRGTTVGAEWEIADNPEMSSPIAHTGTFTLMLDKEGVIPPNSVRYARMRYIGQDNNIRKYSEWSDVFRYEVPDYGPNKPTITVVQNGNKFTVQGLYNKLTQWAMLKPIKSTAVEYKIDDGVYFSSVPKSSPKANDPVEFVIDEDNIEYGEVVKIKVTNIAMMYYGTKQYPIHVSEEIEVVFEKDHTGVVDPYVPPVYTETDEPSVTRPEPNDFRIDYLPTDTQPIGDKKLYIIASPYAPIAPYTGPYDHAVWGHRKYNRKLSNGESAPLVPKTTKAPIFYIPLDSFNDIQPDIMHSGTLKYIGKYSKTLPAGHKPESLEVTWILPIPEYGIQDVQPTVVQNGSTFTVKAPLELTQWDKLPTITKGGTRINIADGKVIKTVYYNQPDADQPRSFTIDGVNLKYGVTYPMVIEHYAKVKYNGREHELKRVLKYEITLVEGHTGSVVPEPIVEWDPNWKIERPVVTANSLDNITVSAFRPLAGFPATYSYTSWRVTRNDDTTTAEVKRTSTPGATLKVEELGSGVKISIEALHGGEYKGTAYESEWSIPAVIYSPEYKPVAPTITVTEDVEPTVTSSGFNYTGKDLPYVEPVTVLKTVYTVTKDDQIVTSQEYTGEVNTYKITEHLISNTAYVVKVKYLISDGRFKTANGDPEFTKSFRSINIGIETPEITIDVRDDDKVFAIGSKYKISSGNERHSYSHWTLTDETTGEEVAKNLNTPTDLTSWDITRYVVPSKKYRITLQYESYSQVSARASLVFTGLSGLPEKIYMKVEETPERLLKLKLSEYRVKGNTTASPVKFVYTVKDVENVENDKYDIAPVIFTKEDTSVAGKVKVPMEIDITLEDFLAIHGPRGTKLQPGKLPNRIYIEGKLIDSVGNEVMIPGVAFKHDFYINPGTIYYSDISTVGTKATIWYLENGNAVWLKIRGIDWFVYEGDTLIHQDGFANIGGQPTYVIPSTVVLQKNKTYTVKAKGYNDIGIWDIGGEHTFVPNAVAFPKRPILMAPMTKVNEITWSGGVRLGTPNVINPGSITWTVTKDKIWVEDLNGKVLYSKEQNSQLVILRLGRKTKNGTTDDSTDLPLEYNTRYIVKTQTTFNGTHVTPISEAVLDTGTPPPIVIGTPNVSATNEFTMEKRIISITTAGSFAITGHSDTKHYATTWRLYDTKTNKKVAEVKDTTNLTSYKFIDGENLEEGTLGFGTYRVGVVYHGANDSMSAEGTVTITTPQDPYPLPNLDVDTYPTMKVTGKTSTSITVESKHTSEVGASRVVYKLTSASLGPIFNRRIGKDLPKGMTFLPEGGSSVTSIAITLRNVPNNVNTVTFTDLIPNTPVEIEVTYYYDSGYTKGGTPYPGNYTYPARVNDTTNVTGDDIVHVTPVIKWSTPAQDGKRYIEWTELHDPLREVCKGWTCEIREGSLDGTLIGTYTTTTTEYWVYTRVLLPKYDTNYYIIGWINFGGGARTEKGHAVYRTQPIDDESMKFEAAYNSQISPVVDPLLPEGATITSGESYPLYVTIPAECKPYLKSVEWTGTSPSGKEWKGVDKGSLEANLTQVCPYYNYTTKEGTTVDYHVKPRVKLTFEDKGTVVVKEKALW